MLSFVAQLRYVDKQNRIVNLVNIMEVYLKEQRAAIINNYDKVKQC